jgi:tRNA_anti-like
MRKYLVLAGSIFLLVLVIWAIYLYKMPHTSVAGIEPEIKMEAAELCKQYQQDENGSNKKYLNKVIEIKGTVKDVRKNDTSMNVLVGDLSAAGGVSCSFLYERGKNLNLPQIGAISIIKGKCTGFLMDVILVDCVTNQ